MNEYMFLNAFNPDADEQHEIRCARDIYKYECWIPESQIAIGDTYIFYNDIEVVPDFVREYVKKYSKPAGSR